MCRLITYKLVIFNIRLFECTFHSIFVAFFCYFLLFGTFCTAEIIFKRFLNADSDQCGKYFKEKYGLLNLYSSDSIAVSHQPYSRKRAETNDRLDLFLHQNRIGSE